MRSSQIVSLGTILALVACATSPDGPDTIVENDVVDTAEPREDRAEPEPEPGCPEGEELCGDECVDLTSDRLNCGGCAMECVPDGINMTVDCVESTCVSSCA